MFEWRLATKTDLRLFHASTIENRRLQRENEELKKVRHQERIVFETKRFDNSSIFIVSYFLSELRLVSRVVPEAFFWNTVKQFERALPKRARHRLSDLSRCGEQLSISSRAGFTSVICLDPASLIERDSLLAWWKEIQQAIRI